MKKGYFIVGLALVIVVGLFYFLSQAQTETRTMTWSGGGPIEVLVADNPTSRAKGLSGTEVETLGADGMMFVWEDPDERTFWMNQMNYNLDVIWIREGKVVKITYDVPAPEGNEEPERMHSRPFEVDMVLEVPAGQATALNIVEGHLIELEGYEQ